MHSQFSRAANLIEKHGREITILNNSLSGDDWNPTVSSMEFKVKAVQTQFNALERQNALVRDNDVRYLIKYDGTEINEQMKIVDGGRTLSIVDVTEVKPGETTILWKVHGRA